MGKRWSYYLKWVSVLVCLLLLGGCAQPTKGALPAKPATQAALPAASLTPSASPVMVQPLTASPNAIASPAATLVPTASRTLIPSLTPLPTRKPSATLSRARVQTLTAQFSPGTPLAMQPTAPVSGTIPATMLASASAIVSASISPTATLVLTVAPGGYDGIWAGMTSNSLPITFTVASNQVVSLAYEDKFSTSGCSYSFLPTPLSFPGIAAAATAAPVPTVQKPFSLDIVREQFSVLIQTTTDLLSFGGRFRSPTTAYGTLERMNTRGSCPFDHAFTWTAAKH